MINKWPKGTITAIYNKLNQAHKFGVHIVTH
jgi:hypothetical protein